MSVFGALMLTLSHHAKEEVFSKKPQDGFHLDRFNATRSVESCTHNPVLEGDQLLLLLLPALKVSIDQGLQLDQILVLTFFLDVLRKHGSTESKLKTPNDTSKKSFTPSSLQVCLHQSPLSHPQGSWERWACRRERERVGVECTGADCNGIYMFSLLSQMTLMEMSTEII